MKNLIIRSSFFLLFFAPAAAMANPTQEDVFKSISDNMSQKSSDSGHFLAVLMGVAGIVALCVFFSRRERKVAVPKVLNHSGKLMKEVVRGIHLRPAELRQLRNLAEAQEIEHPLTLLLCPSVLEKAIRERPGKVERKVMLQLTRKMGLAGKGK